MNPQTLLEHFDLLADIPGAVPKLRELILRLAMQGKLSEPHRTDAPVSELLREVEKDKMRLGLESSAKATTDPANILLAFPRGLEIVFTP